MSDEQVSDRVLTIPNLVSFIRLLGVGVFWWVLLGLQDIPLAALLIFAIGWTDWVDGYLARRLNQVSKLGTALDPVADRLMIASAVVGGLMVDPRVVPLVIGIPLILREVFVGLTTLNLMVRGAGTLEVRWLGKASTFLIYGAIPSFYLSAADIVPWLFGTAAWIAGGIGLVTYWIVAFQYFGDARKALAELESETMPEEN